MSCMAEALHNQSQRTYLATYFATMQPCQNVAHACQTHKHTHCQLIASTRVQTDHDIQSIAQPVPNIQRCSTIAQYAKTKACNTLKYPTYFRTQTSSVAHNTHCKTHAYWLHMPRSLQTLSASIYHTIAKHKRTQCAHSFRKQ